MDTARALRETLTHIVRSHGPLRPVSTAMALPLLVVLALPAHAGAPAGGSITFSPANVAAVPTLGGALLLLLAALMALIAIKAYRRADQGIAPMLAGALALGSLASTGGGIELMQRAHAANISSVTLTNPSGETTVLRDGQNLFSNESGVPLVVSDIELDENCSIDDNSTEDPFCVDTTTEPGEQCEVSLACLFEV